MGDGMSRNECESVGASRPATYRREVGSSSQPRQNQPWRNACELIVAEIPRSFNFTIVTSSFVHVVNVLEADGKAKWAMEVRGGAMGSMPMPAAQYIGGLSSRMRGGGKPMHTCASQAHGPLPVQSPP